MARSSPLLALAAGVGAGYMGAERQKDLDAERKEDRQLRKQQVDNQQDEFDQKKKLRISLADAARPVTVNDAGATLDVSGKPVAYDDAGVANSDFRQARSMGLADVQAPQPAITVNGNAYADKPSATAAAAATNSPDAVSLRQGQAYRAAGMPGEALGIEQKQAQISGAAAAQAKKLKEEGVFDAVRAFRAGDATGLAKALNVGGQYKLVGEPVLTKEDRDVPGIGSIPSYTAKLNIQGPDGKVSEKSYNSHELSMQMMPYEKALELQRKGTDSDNKATFQGQLIDAKTAALEAKTAAAAGKVNGQPTREERLRYTSLFSDAGRRINETQRAIGALQRDPLFMINAKKPNSPEAAQLAELKGTLQQHTEERTQYQQMLAQSTGPSLASAENRGQAGTQAQRDGGRLEILQNELSTAQQRLTSGDPRAQGDVDALNREIAGTRPSLANSRPTAAAPGGRAPAARAPVPAAAKPTDFSNLWK